jgi:hypothetical protein
MSSQAGGVESQLCPLGFPPPLAACFCTTSPRHLRRQVLWGPTEGFHSGPVTDAFFAQAEVSDLDVPIFVQHEILQLRAESVYQWLVPPPIT